MAVEGFRYLSPWLPMKEGWYRIGHVGARTGDVVHRWRLCKAHERNAATGERWERWRLFYDGASLRDDVVLQWSDPLELQAAVRDRAQAGEIVEERFKELCDGKARGKTRSKAGAS
jgi:hypothetical protein